MKWYTFIAAMCFVSVPCTVYAEEDGARKLERT